VTPRGESREARFRRLYLENYCGLLAFALRRVPESVAHDVVADTFLVLWRRLDNVPDDETQLWLYGVARRTVLNQQRSWRRLERLKARLLALPGTRRSVGGDVAEPDEISLVLANVGRLPDGDREVLLLSAWEGLSNDEIARVEGCTSNAVAIRIHRARRRLGELCAKDMAAAGHEAADGHRVGAAANGRRPRGQGVRPLRGARSS
jgi:RNA polymerase sigma-70 factor (ECF subfamily)